MLHVRPRLLQFCSRTQLCRASRIAGGVQLSTMSHKKPFMIGVAGGTASGKSTVCEKLMEKLGQNEMNNVEKQVVHLAQDSFYKELDNQEIVKANKGMFNFDHPNAFDNELMESCLEVGIQLSFHGQISHLHFRTL